MLAVENLTDKNRILCPLAAFRLSRFRLGAKFLLAPTIANLRHSIGQNRSANMLRGCAIFRHAPFPYGNGDGHADFCVFKRYGFHFFLLLQKYSQRSRSILSTRSASHGTLTLSANQTPSTDCLRVSI